ncbi:MAG: dipeptide epimerase [Capsulimonadales bacterium]|nr:dipeptide epimerase [Capsulimonadales bacterium]
MPEIKSVEVRRWNVPMRSPYRSAQRITRVAANVLVRVTLTDGAVGYGESAPAAYVTGETQETVRAAVLTMARELIGKPPEAALAAVLQSPTRTPGARGALETAIRDARSRSEGRPFYREFPATAETPVLSIRTDLSLPLLPPDEAAERATRFAAVGFRSFKIKVDGKTREDEARVRAVAESAPGTFLRIDGNQAFSATEAIHLVRRLDDLLPRLQMFEQPTPAGDDQAMFQVQDAIPIPVFADESVRHPTDAARLLNQGACRGVVLKIAKSGIAETLAIGRAVRDAGGVCLFGCMMETRVAISAAVHLAVALGPEIVPFLDLDGPFLVDDSRLVRGGIRIDGDILRVSETDPGLGVAPDFAATDSESMDRV